MEGIFKKIVEKIFIIGCEPKIIEASVDLSEEVANSVEKVGERILKLIEELNA